MSIILIIIYVCINIIILRNCYVINYGIFRLPFMMAIVSLYIILPQLVSTYIQPDISDSMFFDTCFMMITCNLAFYLGFNNGNNYKNISSIKYTNIRINNIKYLILILAIIGFIFSYQNANLGNIGEASDRSKFLINNLLSNYLYYATLLSIIIIIKKKKFDTISSIILIAYFSLQIMTIIAGARRSYVIGVVFLLAYLLYNLYPNYKNYIKKLILIIFIFGGVVSASILPIRNAIENGSSISNINYWEEFINSFQKGVNEDTGQDVYNCAYGINYVKENQLYSYGADLWNGFIFNYVPKFVVGEKAKEKLKIETGYDDYIELVTHNITTMTGYFYAFSFLSYFGFIIFYIIGYISGKIYFLSNFSSLYKLLYLLLLLRVHSLFSHGIQYYISTIENFIILLLPIIFSILYKSKIVNKKTKL